MKVKEKFTVWQLAAFAHPHNVAWCGDLPSKFT
jgi:hypothetical protein